MADENQTDGPIYNQGQILNFMMQGAAYAGVVLAVCGGFIYVLYLISFLLPEDPYAALAPLGLA